MQRTAPEPPRAGIPEPRGAFLPAWPASILDDLFDGVMVTDADFSAPDGVRIAYVNQAVCDITGYAAGELLGHSPRMLQGPQTDQGLIQRLGRELRAGGCFQGQTINYRKDGTPFTMEWSISPVPGPTGEPEWFVAVQRDATLASRRLLAAEHAARTDALTGLPNRTHMDDVLRDGAWLAVRAQTGLIVDVDHFKSVNDTYGHHVGDEVLRIIGQRLAGVVRGGDLVARWGGEEFCVVALAGGAQVKDLAERLRAAIADSPFETSAGALHITVSVGSASISRDVPAADDMLRAADRALYEAKRTGRNRVCYA